MLNERLIQLAQKEWEFARECLLTPPNEFQLQIVLVPADESQPDIMTVIPEPPLSPYEIVRGLLLLNSAQAFVMTSEAWHVTVPKEIANRGMDAVRFWRRTLPENLFDLPEGQRGESLSLIALGRDFTLQLCVNFKRGAGHVTFEPEERFPGLPEVQSRFFGLREYLVAPGQQQQKEQSHG
jgi:hypothetical protein